jgi:hypothetical protein
MGCLNAKQAQNRGLNPAQPGPFAPAPPPAPPRIAALTCPRPLLSSDPCRSRTILLAAAPSPPPRSSPDPVHLPRRDSVTLVPRRRPLPSPLAPLAGTSPAVGFYLGFARPRLAPSRTGSVAAAMSDGERRDDDAATTSAAGQEPVAPLPL